MNKKAFKKGLLSSLLAIGIACLVIPAFFFLFSDGWGTEDSLIELKFTGYYIAILASVVLFIKDLRAQISKVSYVAGFFMLPLLIGVACSYWYFFMLDHRQL